MKLSREEIKGIKNNFNQKGYYAIGNLTGKAILDMALAALDMVEAIETYDRADASSKEEHDARNQMWAAFKKWVEL